MAQSFTSVQTTAGDGTPLLGDLYRPSAGLKPPFPVTLLFHGGAWIGGTREMNIAQAQDFARNGFIAILCDYRLCGKSGSFLPGQTAPAFYPEQAGDVRSWVSFARALKYSNGQVAAWGSSAGGTNAVHASFQGEQGKDAPDVVIAMSAAYDFSDPESLADVDIPLAFGINVPKYANCSPALDKGCLLAASPISQASQATSPMFLSQGELDTLPRNQLGLFIAELDRLSFSNYQAEIVPKGGHAYNHWNMPLSNGDICRDAAIAFVKSHLA